MNKYLVLKPVATAVFCLALAACGGSKGGDPRANMPPPVVSVITVQPQTIDITTELSGRLQPVREAKVVAQATGIVKRRLFTEGSMVKAGQPLFQIDNAPYLAQLQTAQAQLASAQANQAKADADIVRYRPLAEANAISKQEFDAALAQQRLARAQVKSAQAAVKSAQINVGYTYVTAPISGHIGKALVSEGSLVNQGQGTQLALIQQTDTLYVDLNQSAAAVMKLRQEIAAGKMQAVEGKLPVTIQLDDGTPYVQKGRLLFTDPTVDPNTGQVSLRAEVPNEGNLLMPGMYVKVQIPQVQVQNAFLVPQQAVTRGSGGDSVMVANRDGSYAPRQVTVSREQNGQWIITSGLNAGDQVIVDGMAWVQMMQAKKVKTQPYNASAPAQAAPLQGASAAAKS